MHIIGLDEVGRGCFAGPLTVAAVRLQGKIDGLADSKQLTPPRRSTLEHQIRIAAADISIAWCSAAVIDASGLAVALQRCFRLAFSSISKQVGDRVIIDGTINYLSDVSMQPTEAIAKADDTEPAVMAASIIAKQARDRYMVKQSIAYPEYGFERHVGYGTQAHRTAIKRYGVVPLHRLSLKPLQHYESNPRSDSRSQSM